jgi:hypothetical protein
MTKAQDVFKQIKTHYGEGEYINRCDLSNHLRDDEIDTGVRVCHKHDGFNSPMNYEDAIPLVMYYDDASVLVVSIDRIFAAQED